MFHTDATIGCKFDVHPCYRDRRGLYARRRPFLNPLSEFRENVKIKSFIIKNVLQCIKNV